MSVYEDSLAAFRAGETGLAEELALELLAEARDDDDVAGQVNALCMLARVALRRGDLRHTAELEEGARRLARRAGERRLEKIPIHMQAVAVRMRGDFQHARMFYEESIELNVQIGEERMVAAEWRNLAYVELHAGRGDRARQLFAMAADQARARGYHALEPYLLLDAAVLALEDGDRDSAASLVYAMHAALAAAGEVPDPDDATEEDWVRYRLLELGVI
jgi:hypothetical protein